MKIKTLILLGTVISSIFQKQKSQGQIVYKLKTPYRNGTTHIVLDPLDFLSRLASLIPRPRIHLIRFPKAAFAPNCKYRSLVIPQPALLEKTSLK